MDIELAFKKRLVKTEKQHISSEEILFQQLPSNIKEEEKMEIYQNRNQTDPILKSQPPLLNVDNYFGYSAANY